MFRGGRSPPTIRSTGNRLQILFESGTADARNGASKLGKGFLVYYKAITPGPETDVTMAASLTGRQYYPKAIAFLSSPLFNVSDDNNCLTFRYSLRSNLRVKITSHSRRATLMDWAVDGGRAFHRTAIDLPQGIYKIIWETTDSREYLGDNKSPHNLYRATVKDANIYPMKCHNVGRLCCLLFIVMTAIDNALYRKITRLQGFTISI